MTFLQNSILSHDDANIFIQNHMSITAMYALYDVEDSIHHQLKIYSKLLLLSF